MVLGDRGRVRKGDDDTRKREQNQRLATHAALTSCRGALGEVSSTSSTCGRTGSNWTSATLPSRSRNRQRPRRKLTAVGQCADELLVAVVEADELERAACLGARVGAEDEAHSDQIVERAELGDRLAGDDHCGVEAAAEPDELVEQRAAVLGAEERPRLVEHDDLVRGRVLRDQPHHVRGKQLERRYCDPVGARVMLARDLRRGQLDAGHGERGDALDLVEPTRRRPVSECEESEPGVADRRESSSGVASVIVAGSQTVEDSQQPIAGLGTHDVADGVGELGLPGAATGIIGSTSSR